MQFYCAKGTIAVASAVALNEAGLSYEPVLIDFAAAEQSSEGYLSVNPKARVPSLVTDDGVITETMAILDYIAAIAPDAELMPTDPFQAAQVRSVMSYLASTMHVNHAHKMRGYRWADQQSSYDDMRAKVPQTMAESCAFVEAHALTGPFVMGDRFTVADAHLFALCSWLEGDGVTLADFPKLAQFYDLMWQRPSVLKAKADGLFR